MLEKKKTRKKGIQISGWARKARNARNAKRVSNRQKMGGGGEGYSNRYMIRILAMRSYVERVGNLRQHVH